MKLRFTLGMLMGLVILAAIGLAALKNPSPLWASSLFTLDVILLGFATLGAIARRGLARMPWIGFASFGWLYLGLSFGFLGHSTMLDASPALVTDAGLERIDRALNPRTLEFIGTLTPITRRSRSVVTATFDGPVFRQVGHSLSALLFGTLGGFLGYLAVPRGGGTPDREDRTSAGSASTTPHDFRLRPPEDE